MPLCLTMGIGKVELTGVRAAVTFASPEFVGVATVVESFELGSVAVGPVAVDVGDCRANLTRSVSAGGGPGSRNLLYSS